MSPQVTEVKKSENQSRVDKIAIKGMYQDAWRPPDRRPPWKWAEENVKAIPYSPIPGGFRSDNSPWIRKPLEALVDVTVRKVQIVAGIQASKTLGSEVGSAYIVANMPGPMLWLDQKDEEAQDEMENRLTPLWQNSPAVDALLPGKTGKNRYKAKRNRVTFLNGMTAWVLGAHNKKNLQRRSVRWLIGDETWSWPAGHMAEAEARVTAFGWLGKIFFSSQAGEEDDDTDRSFLGGTQEEWEFACANEECGHVQPYEWNQVVAEGGGSISNLARLPDGGYDYEVVREKSRIECKECGHEHDTSEIRTRRVMNDPLRGADFRVMNPNAPKNYRSFHWNGMCSTPVGELMVLYLRAKEAAKTGDLEPLKIFYQKRLAVPWNDNREDFKMEIESSSYMEGEPWDEECIIPRNGIPMPRPPEPEEDDYETTEEFVEAHDNWSRLISRSSPGRMMKVDCQRDHFWVTVSSITERGDSRLLWCGGGREDKVKWRDGDERHLLTWEDLDDVQEKWGVANQLVFIDAGYDTARVYLEAGSRGWTCLMGDKRSTFAHRIKEKGGRIRRVDRFYSPAKRVNMGKGVTATVYYYSNLNIKDILARIRGNQNPEEGVTYEVPDDVPDEFLRQMESEHRVKLRTGKSQWEQIGKRPNHFFDTEAMGVAGLVMMKLIGRESLADNDPADEEIAENTA